MRLAEKGLKDDDKSRSSVLSETGDSFWIRLQFGRLLKGEKNFYIRLAGSEIDKAKIKEGLEKSKAFIEI